MKSEDHVGVNNDSPGFILDKKDYIINEADLPLEEVAYRANRLKQNVHVLILRDESDEDSEKGLVMSSVEKITSVFMCIIKKIKKSSLYFYRALRQRIKWKKKESNIINEDDKTDSQTKNEGVIIEIK
ncbi:hypothetical protein TCON_1020 [Astathelohania contejeani]|uniref:Uncharacterized protein n=1 Tax=Astathelohania contejeani TaxID=164912 RepID=A0ABQ7I046_9MICR|nr:hypothetical protein TCON_1020 [Thelohania contejeani]